VFNKILELLQLHEFSDSIDKLKRQVTLSPKLHTYTENSCSFSLLRVGGKLLKAKFPLLLSKGSQFVKAYVSHLHASNCHAGPRALISLLHKRIWLINAQEVCRRTVRSCITCFRFKPKLLTQIMGNLQADRLRALRPFTICGVDFCGPISTTFRIRGEPPYKSYVALFICFASKAVYLELVSDLTTDAFLLAFQRFVARRGIPVRIHCENATNFVGADRNMKEFRARLEEQAGGISDFASRKGWKLEAHRSAPSSGRPTPGPTIGGTYVPGQSYLLAAMAQCLVSQAQVLVAMVPGVRLQPAGAGHVEQSASKSSA